MVNSNFAVMHVLIFCSYSHKKSLL